MTATRMRRAAPLPLVAVLGLLLWFIFASSALAAPPGSSGATLAPSPAAADSVGTGTAPTTETATTAPPETPKRPSVQAKAAVLINMDDGRLLFAKNADERRPMASTTKIMTGILALEKLPLDRVVVASKQAAAAGESEIYLLPGEKLTVEQLLEAVLVKSANDAAADLAEAVAGSQDAFVDLMNQKAEELGLSNTHFQNPHGLTAKGHYSSARDLATLARYAMKNPDFRRLVATKKTTIPWPGRPYERVLKNHNTLLGVASYVTGVKTGFTLPAGFCLVGSGSKGGVSLVTVVLGESNKAAVDQDTKRLLEYGFSSYKQVVLVEKGTRFASLDIPYQLDGKLPLVTDRSLVRTVYVGEQVSHDVDFPMALVPPVDQGSVLGKVRYLGEKDGNPLGEVNLVALRAVERPTLGVKVQYFWQRFLQWVQGVL